MAALLQRAASFSSMESFSPTFPLAYAHPKAALGILIFMLMLPLQSCLFNFWRIFWIWTLIMPFTEHSSGSQLSQWSTNLYYHFHVLWQQLTKIFQFALSQSHSSGFSNPVRLFINHYFESSNDPRAVCALHTQPRALQSAPPCVLLTWALPHFQWLCVHTGKDGPCLPGNIQNSE